MGAHCPTKSASWCRSNIFNISEVAIDAPAAHKNVSEESFAVCSSMARATGPSLCSMGFFIQGVYESAYPFGFTYYTCSRCWDKFSAFIEDSPSLFSEIFNECGSQPNIPSLLELRRLETGFRRSKLKFRDESWGRERSDIIISTLFLAMSSLFLCSCADHPLPPSTPASSRPKIQGEGDIRPTCARDHQKRPPRRRAFRYPDARHGWVRIPKRATNSWSRGWRTSPRHRADGICQRK